MRIKLENRMSRGNSAISYGDLKRGDAFVFANGDADNPEDWCIVSELCEFQKFYYFMCGSCKLGKFKQGDMVIRLDGVKIIREAD